MIFGGRYCFSVNYLTCPGFHPIHYTLELGAVTVDVLGVQGNVWKDRLPTPLVLLLLLFLVHYTVVIVVAVVLS